MEIKKVKDTLPIPLSADVRYKVAGNVREVIFSSCIAKGGNITKLDKDTYMVNSTGEVKEINHIENRSNYIASVKRSMSKLRDYINTNVKDVRFCRWLTLTYAENVTDTKKVYFDFKNFVKRARSIYGHFEYIACLEPQGRGAWHLHVILIFDHIAPFMPNDVVADCWKKGFVTIKALESKDGTVDNLGAYLTAYLCDVELEEFKNEYPNMSIGEIKEVEFKGENGENKKKKYVKGGRLWRYPPGCNLFRCSRGIEKPEVSEMLYFEAKEKIGSAKPTYSQTILLKDEVTGFSNTITREYYNILRK